MIKFAERLIPLDPLIVPHRGGDRKPDIGAIGRCAHARARARSRATDSGNKPINLLETLRKNPIESLSASPGANSFYPSPPACATIVLQTGSLEDDSDIRNRRCPNRSHAGGVGTLLRVRRGASVHHSI